jgi:hypothetical protein
MIQSGGPAKHDCVALSQEAVEFPSLSRSEGTLLIGCQQLFRPCLLAPRKDERRPQGVQVPSRIAPPPLASTHKHGTVLAVALHDVLFSSLDYPFKQFRQTLLQLG